MVTVSGVYIFLDSFNNAICLSTSVLLTRTVIYLAKLDEVCTIEKKLQTTLNAFFSEQRFQ